MKIWAKGGVTDLSRTCRRRHGEVGIVEIDHIYTPKQHAATARNTHALQCLFNRPTLWSYSSLGRSPKVNLWVVMGSTLQTGCLFCH